MSGTATTIVTGVVVVLAVVALALLLTVRLRRRRSQRLRQRFGPEYERVLSDIGDRDKAERTLEERVERRQSLPIRDLEPAARERYVGQWHGVQGSFVDDPRAALREAEELLDRLMRDRGYPAEEFEQQLADVSVDHAGAIPGYREAHELASPGHEDAGTDRLREGLVRYRMLFQSLVGEQVTPAGDVRRREEVRR